MIGNLLLRTEGRTLQQYLPFTVLKLQTTLLCFEKFDCVATVLTVYGIETQQTPYHHQYLLIVCCNSAYRLRYLTEY